MHFRSISFLVVLALAGVFSGCGGPAANNGNTANAGNANSGSTNPLETTKPAAEQITNDAPTLTPLLKSYCTAKLKKDEAGLRSAFSKGTLESFEEQMKEDKVKTLVEFLEDEKVTEKRCEVKNERISGDTAVATIFYDSYPNGVEMYFEKENGEWKMTNKSPTLEGDKRSNSNTANTAK